MEDEKKKHDFGKGFLVGGLVGLGVGVAGTCVAAALMSDDEPEIEDQEDEQIEETETSESVLGTLFKTSEKESARDVVKEDVPIDEENESTSS